MRRNLIILAAAFLVTGYAAAAQTLPPALIGDWQVVNVGTDTWISSSDSVVPDDPYIVGRRVVINEAEISSPMSYLADCKAPEVSRGAALSLDNLVALTDGDRQSEPVKPLAKDYDLALPGSQQVTPLMLQCREGHFADEGVNIKPWLVLADQNTLLVSGNMSSILTLKKINGDRPSPSFNCGKAQQEDEQAICRSFDLAAWDVSVNKAYHLALAYADREAEDNRQLKNTLQQEQKAWIKKRAACKADSQCLYKSMRDRLETLNKQS